MATANAHKYKLYISASAPTGGSEDETSEYTQVLQLRSYDLGGSKAEVDETTLDDTSNTKTRAGVRTDVLNLAGLFDPAGDTGQEILETNYLLSATAAADLYYLITDDTTGNKLYYGQGPVVSYQVNNSGGESPIDFTASIACNTLVTADADAV